VTAVHDEREHNIDDAHMLEHAALAESHSSHPIASSIRRAYEADGATLDKGRVTDVQEVSGKGVIAEVDAMQVAAGNLKLMKMLGVACEACRSVGTIVYVASRSEAADPENGQPAGEGSVQAGGSWEYLGHIVISDEIKPGAADAIRQMKQNGIVKAVMLTGDITSMAESVAREVGIDEVHAELLPEDKVTLVEKLLAEKKAAASPKATLAFVGDGINDAPVLAIADLGIAMGALGSDAAIEAADVVLMDDDPAKIVKAMRIARKCIRIVNENIWFAIGVKFTCLILGALGIANMWLAIFADVGVMVLCVLNSVRALFVKGM
jgi:Cd2+/Zn2+-exporting ATPase